MGEIPESYVPPTEFREYRSLARGRKKYRRQAFRPQERSQRAARSGWDHARGSLWSNEGREFLAELTLDGPSQLILDHWLEAIDEFTEKIKRIQREIEEIAAAVRAS